MALAPRKPFKMRLPDIANEKLIEGMKQQSDELEELETWQKTMEAGPRYGENLFFASVPEIHEADIKYYSKILALGLEVDTTLGAEEIWKRALDPADNPGRNRWKLMHCWLHAVHTPNDFIKIVIAGGATEGASSAAGFSMTPAKLLLLDNPDSEIWTDDERLCIMFAKATCEWTMTDEIFAAAVEAWGVKWVLAALALLAHYYGYAMRFSAVGLDRVNGLRADLPIAAQVGLTTDKDE